MRLSFLSLLLLGISIPAFAQQRLCSGAQGSDRVELPSGYIAQVSGAIDQPHAGQCHATITSSDGKVQYELFGPEIAISPVSGTDVNGDGKPDAVIESHPLPRQCCWNYYIVTPGETPAVQRQLTTSVPLTFEDRLGDGKVEIWTRDFAFDNVEGFPRSETPQPMIFFRLRGKTLYDVSPLFWTEYEREINEARSGISNADVDELTKIENDNAKPTQEGDPKIAHLLSVRALILTVALDNLYGGHGADCWKTISEMWPTLDRQRIRQLILQRRMHGILGEINKTQPAAN